MTLSSAVNLKNQSKVSPDRQRKLDELNGSYYSSSFDKTINRKLSMQPYQDSSDGHMYQSSYSRQFDLIKQSLDNVRNSQAQSKSNVDLLHQNEEKLKKGILKNTESMYVTNRFQQIFNQNNNLYKTNKSKYQYQTNQLKNALIDHSSFANTILFRQQQKQKKHLMM